MDGTKTTLERAFELAKSGQCFSMDDIRRKLSSEGYSLGQMTGATLSRQLRALMKDATVER
jgi:DNA-binding HxlR family transcriptional regulator